MKNISEIDKNFKVETKIERENLQFFDAETSPFRIYGLLRENGRFCRMPEEAAKGVSDGVHGLYANTAGGRVRFRTNSPYVAISAQMDGIGKMPHFALSGSAGFDLYADEGSGQIYRGTFVPPFDLEKGYESVLDFPDNTERLITINFPLYSNVTKLYIGLDSHSMQKPAPDYKYEKPVVYYGSSITQGGCASRPGNSYQAIVSRRLDCNFINLGFSGNAKGEDDMTDYINGLDMSIFVMDYDHNAPTVEHLAATHRRMFQKIREKHPTLPIIMMTRPKVHLTAEEKERSEIVRKTYLDALDAGDEHVCFLQGSDLIHREVWETATVDNVHPNDSGFVSMAYTLCDLIIEII